VVSNAMLRKISSDVSYQRPNTSVEARDQIKQRLLNCAFDIELSTPALRVPIAELSELVIGDLLPLERSASAPAYLEVGEMPLGTAAPVRVGARRAARVLMLGAEFGPGAEMKAKNND
jgi:flagellar motor switch protein FliM